MYLRLPYTTPLPNQQKGSEHINAEQTSENTIVGTIQQNPNRYAPYSGTNAKPTRKEYVWTTDKELVLKPLGTFCLHSDRAYFDVRLPGTFLSTADKYKAGTRLWMEVELGGNTLPRLCQVMEADIHAYLVDGVDKEDAPRQIRHFWECPDEMRQEIVRRRFSRKVQRKDIRSPEITSQFFAFAYRLSKNGYSMEQQDRIKRLMPKGGRAFADKSELQLDYIMNISEEYPRRVFLEYDEIMKVLNERIYGQEEQKHCIAELLANRSFAEDRGVKILLVGSEGAGKSRFLEVIRELVTLPSAVIELGGESNPCALLGHNATYWHADAGDILKTYRKLRTTEAVIGWTDIDRMSESREGVAINALKGIISEDCLVDKFTLYPLSTRHRIHIAEATSDQNLPDFVKNHFTIIRLDPYSEDDKVSIATQYTVPELYHKVWLGDILAEQEPEETALRFIARNFCGDDGMKQMETCCAMVTKRMVQEKLLGNTLPFNEQTVRAVLGDSPDRSDPMIRYNLSRGLYSPKVEDAIRDARERLKNEKLRSEEKAVEELRLGYLVDMAQIVPKKLAFDRNLFLKAMNGTHYGLSQVKELLADYFAAQAARGGSFSGMRILLEGPAGGGKTSLIESMANALHAAYVRIALNNISEASILKGLYKSIANADAGMIIKGISEARRRMPDADIIIVHLDEVDKLATQFNEILIDLLDDSGLFLDYFLGVPVKLSNILFCGTANEISRIPTVILDRFRMIHMDGYAPEEKAHILGEHLLPDKEKEYSTARITFAMDQEAQDLLLNAYCPSAGVRDLKKAVDRVTEYAVSHRGRRHRLELNASLLQQALGEAPLQRGNLPGRWLPGCVKALSVDGSGAGNCFAVESVVLAEDTSLTVTGLAGESALESVKIAITYLKSRYACACGGKGVHLSFGEGAVHKDGPSAGVAVVVSLLSAMSERCSDPEAAYTGEVDLLGNIYPVGGVIRKIQAAERAGCHRVFIPAENAHRLTMQDRASVFLEIIPVTHVEEVIQAVFEGYEAL